MSINKVLLEYSHDDLFRSSLWLLLSKTCRVEELWETPPAKSKMFIPSGPLQKNLLNPGRGRASALLEIRSQVLLLSNLAALSLEKQRVWTKLIPSLFGHIFNIFMLNERAQRSCHRQGWNWGLPRLNKAVGWDRAGPETLVFLERVLLPTIPHGTQMAHKVPASSLSHEFDAPLSWFWE